MSLQALCKLSCLLWDATHHIRLMVVWYLSPYLSAPRGALTINLLPGPGTVISVQSTRSRCYVLLLWHWTWQAGSQWRLDVVGSLSTHVTLRCLTANLAIGTLSVAAELLGHAP